MVCVNTSSSSCSTVHTRRIVDSLAPGRPLPGSQEILLQNLTLWVDFLVGAILNNRSGHKGMLH
jgi:hypothetical protein